jgi:hypothetical protein
MDIYPLMTKEPTTQITSKIVKIGDRTDKNLEVIYCMTHNLCIEKNVCIFYHIYGTEMRAYIWWLQVTRSYNNLPMKLWLFCAYCRSNLAACPADICGGLV